MISLNGKRLLILGATSMEIDIVRAAREEGVYTIVTDNHVDWSLAPAKRVADEAWDVSWSDIDTLKSLCVERKVDGVLAGFSERRVYWAQKLSQVIDRPFYSDEAQLEIIFDKVGFKQACAESGVRVAESYQYHDQIEFPVIIKPSDNGGSRGITVCYNIDDFEAAYDKALAASDSKEVLIEQYIVADETMVFFTVCDGEPILSAMCDRYMHYFGNGITQLPVGYFYPSKHLNSFITHNLNAYKNLIRRLNIQNGLIAFQAFALGDDLVPFDPTYRLDGTMTYHIVNSINGLDVLKMLIRYSLTGSMGDREMIAQKENPNFGVLAYQLPILLRKGTITHISGLEEIKKMKNVIFVQQNYYEGDIMQKEADFSQIFCRIHMIGTSVQEFDYLVSKIYTILDVVDEEGEDMIICKTSISRIVNS